MEKLTANFNNLKLSQGEGGTDTGLSQVISNYQSFVKGDNLARHIVYGNIKINGSLCDKSSSIIQKILGSRNLKFVNKDNNVLILPNSTEEISRVIKVIQSLKSKGTLKQLYEALLIKPLDGQKLNINTNDYKQAFEDFKNWGVVYSGCHISDITKLYNDSQVYKQNKKGSLPNQNPAINELPFCDLKNEDFEASFNYFDELLKISEKTGKKIFYDQYVIVKKSSNQILVENKNGKIILELGDHEVFPVKWEKTKN